MAQPDYTISGYATYTISADGKSITCRRCTMTSYHPMDILHRYCGECRMFHDALQPHDALSADSLLRENADLLSEIARLQAANAALESQLSQAHERIAVLEADAPRKRGRPRKEST